MAPALTLPHWETMIKLVEQMSSISSTSSLQQLDAQVDKARLECNLRAMTTMPEATWQQVFKAQVPYRLALACANMLKASSSTSSSGGTSSSSGSSSSGSTSASRTAASTAAATTAPSPQEARFRKFALQAMYYLAFRAVFDGIVRRAMSRSYAPSQQAAELGRQLQRAGFLDVLPGLATEAAAYLASLTPARAGAAAAPGGSSASSSGSSSGSADDAFHSLQLFQAEMWLLLYASCLCRCWPQGEFVSAVAPECNLPAIQLSAAMFRFLSQELHAAAPAHRRAHMKDWASKWEAASVASSVAFSIITKFGWIPDGKGGGTTNPPTMPDKLRRFRQELLLSVDTLHCLTVELAAAVYMMLLLQLPALPQDPTQPGASAGSTAAPSTTSSSIRGRLELCASGEAAWLLACTESERLPRTHDRLLRLAGCSSRVAVWSALLIVGAQAIAKDPRSTQEMAEDAFEVYLDRCLRLYEQLSAARRQQLSGPVPRQPRRTAAEQQAVQQELELHYLLPPLLLYWAAHQPLSFSLGSVSARVAAAGAANVEYEPVLHQTNDALFTAGVIGRTCTTVGSCSDAVAAELQQLRLRESMLLSARFGGGLLQMLRSCRSSATASAAAGGSRAGAGSAASSAAGQAETSRTARLEKHITELASLLTSIVTDMTDEEDAPRSAQHSWLPCSDAACIAALQECMVRRDLRQGLLDARWLSVTASTWLQKPLLLQAAGPLEVDEVGEGAAAPNTAAAPAGLGKLHRALISLCISVLKALDSLQPADTRPVQCYLMVLMQATCAGDQIGVLLPDETPEHSTQPAAPAAAATAATSARRAAVVPWLALVGRTLLSLAAQGNAVPGIAMAMLGAPLDWLGRWIEEISNAESFAAACDAAGLHDAWEQLAECRHRFPSADSIIGSLRALGTALSSLAFSRACNNPACTNITGPTEQQLAGSRCSGCQGAARYCGRVCQRQHWKAHKRVCAAIAAAAAEAAAAEGGAPAGSAP